MNLSEYDFWWVDFLLKLPLLFVCVVVLLSVNLSELDFWWVYFLLKFLVVLCVWLYCGSSVDNRTVSQEDVALTHMLLTDPACADLQAAVAKVPALLTKLEERSTVLQTVVVESLQQKGRYLCLANTHLYFHPNAGHVRLLQGAVCLRHIQAMCQPYQEQVGGSSYASAVWSVPSAWKCSYFSSALLKHVHKLQDINAMHAVYDACVCMCICVWHHNINAMHDVCVCMYLHLCDTMCYHIYICVCRVKAYRWCSVVTSTVLQNMA